MRPTLGRVILYTRGDGEEYAGTIARVMARPEMTFEVPSIDADEDCYDVWLAVDIHPIDLNRNAHRWHSPMPVKFDGSEKPAANTWRWPPRV